MNDESRKVSWRTARAAEITLSEAQKCLKVGDRFTLADGTLVQVVPVQPSERMRDFCPAAKLLAAHVQNATLKRTW